MEPTPIVNRVGIAAALCLIAALALTGLMITLPTSATITRTRSGSRSIGSRSGDTRTGTTNGTGVSRTVSNTSDQSRVTRTGTTRGTGPSRSVSNSS